MYMLKGAKDKRRDWMESTRSEVGQLKSGAKHASQQGDAVDGRLRDEALRKPQALVYVDPRKFTRDCVGRWLQNSLEEFTVWLLADLDGVETASIVKHEVRAVIINTVPGRMSAPPLARVLSRAGELLPSSSVVVLSDHEDPESIREAFALGVRAYIPTTLAPAVAVGAVHLVCLGGTFAPAGSLLFQRDSGHGSAGESRIKGFTKCQSRILDCLRRGMTNRLIAHELNICESTVKVHVRNIMKKLNATNRTQVAYMTRGLFQDADRYQHA
jgi:DNA-binding NarL/FixJ family response regulator